MCVCVCVWASACVCYCVCFYMYDCEYDKCWTLWVRNVGSIVQSMTVTSQGVCVTLQLFADSINCSQWLNSQNALLLSNWTILQSSVPVLGEMLSKLRKWACIRQITRHTLNNTFKHINQQMHYLGSRLESIYSWVTGQNKKDLCELGPDLKTPSHSCCDGIRGPSSRSVFVLV